MAKNIDKSVKIVNHKNPAGVVYLTTVVGAAVYFLQNSAGFWNTVLALLKAMVWPAFLVHRVFELLHL